MTLGIVGAEGAKFTREGEQRARALIRQYLHVKGVTKVVSGKCHLGGIDIWAVQEADLQKIPTEEFPPDVHQWTGLYKKRGYKERNIQIAAASDEVLCIAVATYHPGYTGGRFGGGRCYHCPSDQEPHVKSGGCWTTKEARRRGKLGYTVVIDP